MCERGRERERQRQTERERQRETETEMMMMMTMMMMTGRGIYLSDDSLAVLCLSVRGSGMPFNADASIVLASAWSALQTCHT